jgi:hypothetical protein
MSSGACGVVVDENENVSVIGTTNYAIGYITTIKYSQSDITPVSVSLIPFVNPIQIPASGGGFDYYLRLNNPAATAQTVDAWTRLDIPHQGPLTLSNVSLTLQPGVSMWVRHQNVPASYPAGSYKYFVYLGDYPDLYWASDTLLFTKLSTGEGPRVDDWGLTENLLEGSVTAAPAEFQLLPCFPNPFNPTTCISYNLQAASYVSLKVYDTTGKQVVRLFEGWEEAGSHHAIFDGSKLASGIYLARLEAGESSSIQKIVLLK